MISTPERIAGRPHASGEVSDRWVVFQVTWASAVLFHLAGNPTLAPWWGRALLGATAVAAIARPRWTWSAGLLAAGVLVNVWLEAPLLANHWLLHGFVALVVIGSVAAGRGRSTAAMARLLGPARLTLLAFYAFAAFAKLNTDFFEPAASCAVFYLRESADSWGASGLVDGLGPGGDVATAVAVAVIELSVPVLLLVRRTRNIGVVVGLVFHFLLAVDRTHQFADFSSVLAALFLLFLDDRTVGALVSEFRRSTALVTARISPELLSSGLLLVLGGMVVYASGPTSWGAPPVLRELAVFTWLLYGSLLAAAVVVALRREPGDHGRLGATASRWLLAVPALAFLNGLTPYLELKTGAGWNMYSNLAVVDGESNHLIIRRGLPLTDAHERLVRITSSTDQSLDFYIDSPWRLPERQLLDHLADRDGAVVRGTVDGEHVVYRGGEADARPEWQQKFQVFRAVDVEGPVSCQPSFGPAR